MTLTSIKSYGYLTISREKGKGTSQNYSEKNNPPGGFKSIKKYGIMDLS
jgi:hypothetical protein